MLMITQTQSVYICIVFIIVVYCFFLVVLMLKRTKKHFNEYRQKVERREVAFAKERIDLTFESEARNQQIKTLKKQLEEEKNEIKRLIVKNDLLKKSNEAVVKALEDVKEIIDSVY